MNCAARIAQARELRCALSEMPRFRASLSKKNLVYRAVDAVKRELKILAGVAIELRKAIPAGRGLGGGSSDAAAALFGYLRLTQETAAPRSPVR